MIPDNFRQFDYDNEQKNNRVYNSSVPPEYKLNKVIAPVALFSSDDDRLATSKVRNIIQTVSKWLYRVFLITNITVL